MQKDTPSYIESDLHHNIASIIDTDVHTDVHADVHNDIQNAILFDVNIYAGFEKKMRILAVLTGMFIALSMPLTYSVLSWADKGTQAEYVSKQVSQKIIDTIKLNPDLWEFSVVKFTKVFDETESLEVCEIRISDIDGNILSNITYPHFFIITRSGRTEIIYNNILFGYVDVLVNADDTFFTTLILFIVFSFIAAGMSYLLFRLPANIIKKAEVDINLSMTQLNENSYFDPLTQLRNRPYIYKIFPMLTKNIDSMAVLFLDLDNFKNINDSFGHDSGDQLLIAVSKRLKAIVRSNDIIIRFGGDEFMIVLLGITNKKNLDRIVHQLIDSFSNSFLIDGHELNETASIGVAIYPQDGGDLQQLAINADIAMYKAKKSGKNNACYYSKEMSHLSV